MKTKTSPPPAPAPQSKAGLGYINVRISRKAYEALLRVAIAERRTLIAQLEIILEV